MKTTLLNELVRLRYWARQVFPKPRGKQGQALPTNECYIEVTSLSYEYYTQYSPALDKNKIIILSYCTLTKQHAVYKTR